MTRSPRGSGGWRPVPVAVADVVGVVAVLSAALVARVGWPPPSYPVSWYVTWYVAVAAAAAVALYLVGAYDPPPVVGRRPVLPSALLALSTVALVVASAQLLSGVFLVPRAHLLALPSSALWVVTVRYVVRRRRLLRRPPLVVLVGDRRQARAVRHALSSTDPRVRTLRADGDSAAVTAFAHAVGADGVLLLREGAYRTLRAAHLRALDELGGVLQRVSGRDALLGLRSVVTVAGAPFTPVRSCALPPSRRHARRVFELLSLAVVAAPAAAAAAVVAGVVLARAGRPVLFWQRRVGEAGVVFSMPKFRTMRRDAEVSGPRLSAGRGDGRVVSGLRWVRRSRLDELPQLALVATGRMSLVGPRPERPELAASYEGALDGYARRHEIPPGITGLAQVRGAYHTAAEDKLGYDVQYLVNWSPVLDVVIMLRTVVVMLTGRGAA